MAKPSRKASASRTPVEQYQFAITALKSARAALGRASNPKAESLLQAHVSTAQRRLAQAEAALVEVGLHPSDVSIVDPDRPDRGNGAKRPMASVLDPRPPANSSREVVAARTRLDDERRSIVRQLPLQNAQKPGFPSGFLPNPAPLQTGRLGGLPWSTIISRLTETLRDFAVEDVDVIAHLGGERSTAAFHLVRLVAEEPIWVAWASGLAPEFAHSLAVSGWHGWAPRNAAAWHEPGLLIPAGQVKDRHDAVLTWRADDPLSVSRAVLGWIYDRMHVRDPIHVEVVVKLVGEKELKRRRAELARLEHLSMRRPSGQRKRPTAGHCMICHHALADRESLKRGIGPECWKQLQGADVRAVTSQKAAPLSSWVGARPMKTWRKALRRQLMVGNVPRRGQESG